MVLLADSPNLDNIRLHFDPESLFLLNLILAFLMYGIALNLRLNDFKRLFEYPKKAVAGVLSQWVIMPALTYLLVLLLQPQASVALGMFLLAACPGGNMSNYLTSVARGNVALSVTLTAASTVLSVVLTPFNFTFYAGMYEPTANLLRDIEVEPTSMFQTVFILLGVPLLAGMLTAHYLPRLTEVIIKPIRVISLLIFISFIVFAFMANYHIFMQVISVIFIVVLLHNGMGLLSGYGIGALFKLDFEDRKCLSIESGIHNAALGLILIFSFFEGLGGMAIVAGWWGIWDLVSGFILAGYWWSRSNKRTATIG